MKNWTSRGQVHSNFTRSQNGHRPVYHNYDFSSYSFGGGIERLSDLPHILRAINDKEKEMNEKAVVKVRLGNTSLKKLIAR